MRRKIRFLVIVGLLGGSLLVWWLVRLINMPVATVKITTDEQATILISHNDEDFEEVGRGKFVFSSKTAGVLIIRAVDGQYSSQATVGLVLNQVQTVHLSFKQPKTASYYAPGAISYPLITDSFVYGINRNTYDLGVSRRFDDVFSDTSFIAFPKLYRLAWFDEYNFVYSSRDRRIVGLVFEGDSVVLSGTYSDFAVKDGVVFLLSGNSVNRLVFGEGQEVETLWSLEETPAGQIFVSGQHLYIPVLDEESELLDTHSRAAQLNVYSHSGQLVERLALSGADYRNLIEVGDLVFVATYRGLVVLDLGSGNRLFELELTEPVVDILEKDGLVYALTLESGLWQLDLSNRQAGYQLLVNQPPNQIFVENSLSLKDGRLYFSSQTKESALGSSNSAELSSVYYIDLDSD